MLSHVNDGLLLRFAPIKFPLEKYLGDDSIMIRDEPPSLFF